MRLPTLYKCTNRRRIQARLKEKGSFTMDQNIQLLPRIKTRQIPQKTISLKARYFGRLQEFGLGEGKISSDIEDKGVASLIEQLRECLTPVTHDGYAACIDGRYAKRLMNGQSVPVRVRKAGGSMAPFAATCIAKGPLFTTFSRDASSQEIYEGVVNFQLSHSKRESGHVDEFGPSCGAANGAAAHADAVVRKTKEMSQVITALLPEFNPADLTKDHTACVEGAMEFKDSLRSSHWDGPAIVQAAAQRDPAGIAILRGEHNDLHGHREQGLLIVDIPGYSIDQDILKEEKLGEWFVWNLDETKHDARLEAIDEASYRRLCVAGVLNHLGVANNLCAGDMPVILFTNQ